jgi:hypothetical protein
MHAERKEVLLAYLRSPGCKLLSSHTRAALCREDADRLLALRHAGRDAPTIEYLRSMAQEGLGFGSVADLADALAEKVEAHRVTTRDEKSMVYSYLTSDLCQLLQTADGGGIAVHESDIDRLFAECRTGPAVLAHLQQVEVQRASMPVASMNELTLCVRDSLLGVVDIKRSILELLNKPDGGVLAPTLRGRVTPQAVHELLEEATRGYAGKAGLGLTDRPEVSLVCILLGIVERVSSTVL